MRATLRGISGPGGGIEVALETGTVITVGRKETCSIGIAEDTFLSGRHFQIALSGDKWLLRDLGSRNGTYVNGRAVLEHSLCDGESIAAGRTTFEFRTDIIKAPTALELLSRQPEPLYAVLDAARDSAIFPMLLGSGMPHASLYAGRSALTLEAVAPYLVPLPPGCGLLQALIEKGWSRSWGIFLTSSQPPQTVWHELRRSLMVTMAGKQEYVYFRFYDPRVLRLFLHTLDAQQAAEFCGTISSFLLEDEDAASLLRFRVDGGAVRCDRWNVSPFKPAEH